MTDLSKLAQKLQKAVDAARSKPSQQGTASKPLQPTNRGSFRLGNGKVVQAYSATRNDGEAILLKEKNGGWVAFGNDGGSGGQSRRDIERSSPKAPPPPAFKEIMMVYSVDLDDLDETVVYVAGHQAEPVEVFRVPYSSRIHEIFLNNLGEGRFTIDTAIDDTIRQYSEAGLVYSITHPYAVSSFSSGWWWRGHGFWTARVTQAQDSTIPDAPSQSFSTYYYRAEKIWNGEWFQSDELKLTYTYLENGYIESHYTWILPNKLWEHHREESINGQNQIKKAALYGSAHFTFPINQEGTKAIEYGTEGIENVGGTDYSLLITLNNEEKFGERPWKTAGNYWSDENFEFWDYFYARKLELFDDFWICHPDEYSDDIYEALDNGEAEFGRTLKVFNYEFEPLEDIETGGYTPPVDPADDSFFIWWKGSSYHPS